MPTPLSASLHALRSRRLRPSAGHVAATLLVLPAFVAMAVFASLAGHAPASALTTQAAATQLKVPARHAPAHVSRSAVRLPVQPVAARPAPPKPPAPKPPAAPVHQWVRPADGPLSSPFGGRWGRMHEGIDLASPYGAPIRAATDGTIIYAGPESGYGRLILIRDYDGTVTAYGHMSRFVRTSGAVKAGELIALVGAAGDATGAHLHFEVRVGGSPVNPIPLLARHGVRI